MTKKGTTKYFVNYDTKWTHDYLNPKQALYFKAKTSIQEIVPQLENYLNENGPDHLKVNYQPSYMVSNFSRLYRNLAKSYKGWQIFYRKPGSPKNYASINHDQIGSQEKVKNIRALKQILQNRMLWKHDFDPVIQAVEIKSVDSSEFIAKTLNYQFSQGSLDVLLKNWLPYLEGLNKNYHELVKQNLSLDVLTNKTQTW